MDKEIRKEAEQRYPLWGAPLQFLKTSKVSQLWNYMKRNVLLELLQ